MKVSEQNDQVQVIFVSAKNETKVYAHKDYTQISAFRGVGAEKAKRFANLCITEEELTKLIDSALDGVNKDRDFAKAIAILHELKFRVSMICEENSLLDLAYIYLMIEGEDLEKPTQEYNKKKAELVEEEPDLKSFFLQKALSLVDTSSLKQGADLPSYLEEVKKFTIKFQRFHT